MAFENERFYVVEYDPITGAQVRDRIVASTTAARLVLDADPDIDVWNIRLQTNRNAANLHKSNVKGGQRDATRERAVIVAGGQDVAELELVV